MKSYSYKFRVFHWFCVGVLCLFIGSSVQAQWMQTNGPYGGDIKCMTSIGNNIFAGTNAGVFRSTNSGAKWERVSIGLTNNDVTSLAVCGTSILVGTWGDGIFVSNNNGLSWTNIDVGSDDNYIFSIAVSDTNIYVGTFGIIYLSTNSGVDWTTLNTAFWAYSIAVAKLA